MLFASSHFVQGIGATCCFTIPSNTDVGAQREYGPWVLYGSHPFGMRPSNKCGESSSNRYVQQARHLASLWQLCAAKDAGFRVQALRLRI